MINLSEAKWYILNVTVGYEHKAAKSIRDEADRKGMSSFIEDVVIPTEQVTTTRRGKKMDMEKKMLPGYIFIKMQLDKEVWALVKSSSYVAKFLGNANKPAEVQEKEVEAVMSRITEIKEDKKSEVMFSVGETIKILHGAFESFSAIIEAVDEKKKSLKVSVSIFNRETPVELGFDQVEKIKE